MQALNLSLVTHSFSDFTLGPISFKLPSGSIMGLIGENGAGKSTTIRLILGMLRPDSGEIQVLGQSMDGSCAKLKEQIGYVADEPCFPECLTPNQLGAVLGNVYRSWNPTSYQTLLKRFELPPTQASGTFSRGMKMKLSIAAALAHDPKLLILDEATGGLDPVARDEILDLFYDFTRQEDRSILISSHIVSDLEKLCDYVAFLHNGKLLLCQEKDLLFEQYGLIHCPTRMLAQLDRRAIVASRQTPYGAQAMVRRAWVPAGYEIEPICMEDIFLNMIKGGAQA